MRIVFGLVLVAATATAADEPAPLLKPVTPAGDRVRVRVATSEEGSGFYHFAARVPKAKGKETRDEVVEVKVAFDCRSGKSFVTAKKWQSWGYDLPKNKTAVLPELVIPAAQLAPKTSRGRDVNVRLANLKLDIVEPPGDSDKVIGCDLLLAMNEVTRNSDKAFEPRFYFADKFLELTVPGSWVKRGGGEGEAPADPMVNPDAKLVPVVAPMTTRGVCTFAYAAINGQEKYKTADGKDTPVSVAVASTANCPGGVIMTLGTARGCGVEMDGKELTGTGTDFKTTIAKGTVKELRLGFRTGPDQAATRDVVLKNVTVWVDKFDSGHMVWVGPNFLREHFQDPVYACDATGAWRLHGRVKPELLQDVKTRAKK